MSKQYRSDNLKVRESGSMNQSLKGKKSMSQNIGDLQGEQFKTKAHRAPAG